MKILKFAAFVALSLGLTFLAYTFGGSDSGIVTASVLGVLITGAGVQTTFAGQGQCEEYIVIGDVDTANALRGLTVEVDGNTFINIQNSAALMSAFAKWQQETCGAMVGLVLKVATGMIKRNTTYRFTNDGVTTPTVRVFSDSQGGIPILATTKQINALSFEDFSAFSALFLTLPASVASVEIVFADGYKATMTIEEVDAYFSLKNQSEADGRLAGVSVIDNTDQSIKSVRVFAGAVAVTVLIAKLPNDAFKALQG
jgi:hypothetical protein